MENSRFSRTCKKVNNTRLNFNIIRAHTPTKQATYYQGRAMIAVSKKSVTARSVANIYPLELETAAEL